MSKGPDWDRFYSEYPDARPEVLRKNAEDAEQMINKLREQDQKRIAELEAERDRWLDTYRAIAVKGLGLTDPYDRITGPIPEDWLRTEFLSDAVAHIREENARLRQALADAPHEKHCPATWYVPDGLNWYIRDTRQPELCDCWKAALTSEAAK